MPCNTNILQNIINACNPVKGVEPIIFWDYRSNLAFTFVDNTITAITAVPLGRIEVKKFAINAGHDVVVLENQSNRFKHKLDAVINETGQVVDEMDDVVFFVKENGATTWKVYGAKYGCWKESQAAMINDNLGTTAVSFASREGMEEEYESYNTSIDIAALPNMSTFDLIYGGTIATDGAVGLTIDNTKTGYIKLPNGAILTTVAGEIDETYTGVGGAITIYTPKNNSNTNIDASDIAGTLTRAADAAFSFAGCMNVIGLNSQNGLVFNCGGSTNFANLIAPKATTIYASGCALTAKSIGDILYAAYIDNRANVVYDFSGGTNADDADIWDYILTLNPTLSGLSGLSEWLDVTLRTIGGVISYN